MIDRLCGANFNHKSISGKSTQKAQETISKKCKVHNCCSTRGTNAENVLDFVTRGYLLLLQEEADSKVKKIT